MKRSVIAALLALSVAPTISFAQDSTQPELPGLFDSRISEADLRSIIARQMAPYDSQFREGARSVNPNITDEELRSLEGERFLKNGGSLILKGEALQAALADTFFYSSAFDRMSIKKLYSNVDLRFDLSASNLGRGYSTLILHSFDLDIPAEEAKTRATGLAEAVMNTLKSQGVPETQITYTSLEPSTNSSIRKVRIDIALISGAKTAQEAAVLMTNVLEQFPKSSLLAKVGESTRVERAVKGLNLFERAEVDAKKAARAAGKK